MSRAGQEMMLWSFGLVAVDYLVNQRTRTLENALDLEDESDRRRLLAEKISRLESSGYMQTIENGSATDLLRGIAYGDKVDSRRYRVFPEATSAPCAPRPVFTVADVLSLDTWPGESSDYNDDGMSKDFDGDMVKVGKALRLPEVMAILLGLASISAATPAQRANLFNYFATLATSAAGPASATSGGVVYAQQIKDVLWGPIVATGATYTNLTTETNLLAALPTLPAIPAGYLRKPGDYVDFTVPLTIPSGNSTDTLQVIVRQGSTSGTAWATSAAKDVGNSGTAGEVKIRATLRQPSTAAPGSSAANGIVAVSGYIAIDGTRTEIANLITGLDTQSAISLLVDGVWSVANAANQVAAFGGELTGARLP